MDEDEVTKPVRCPRCKRFLRTYDSPNLMGIVYDQHLREVHGERVRDVV
jgi:hypothetical protein